MACCEAERDIVRLKVVKVRVGWPESTRLAAVMPLVRSVGLPKEKKGWVLELGGDARALGVAPTGICRKEFYDVCCFVLTLMRAAAPRLRSSGLSCEMLRRRYQWTLRTIF